MTGFLIALLLPAYPAGAQLTATQSEIWTLESLGLGVEATRDDRFGTVASGDFDGDGLDDLAIGIPEHPLGGFSSGGAVAVIFGSRPTLGGCCRTPLYIDQDSAGAADQRELLDRFGSALAAGDFDGDGHDDLAVGVPGEDLLDIDDVGAVHVFYGPDFVDNELWTLGLLGRGMIGGDSVGERLETGDFDDDGYDDLAVGIGARDVNGINAAGAVVVIYGSESGLRPQGHQLWTLNDVGVVGPEVFALFGGNLAAGDFDGDGFDDLAMSGRETVDPFGRIGHVYVLFGMAIGLAPSGMQVWNEGTLGIAGRSPSSSANFGTGLTAGDFNGDGSDDLGIGAYTTNTSGTGVLNSGALYVLYGNTAGLTTSGSQFWHQDSPGIEGDPAMSDFFAGVLAAGDFNADAFSDVAVGIGGKDIGNAEFAGAVLVIYGSENGLSSNGNQLWHQGSPGIQETAENSDSFSAVGASGNTLAAGDFNGDGGDDLAIGVPLEDLALVDEGLVHVLYRDFTIFSDGFEAGDTGSWSGQAP